MVPTSLSQQVVKVVIALGSHVSSTRLSLSV
jgi:hypothetical protein